MELIYNNEKLDSYYIQAKELVDKMTIPELASQTLHSAAAIERLSIPAYNWWNEALHGVARAGVATVFPQAIGLAAIFDEDFIEQIADAISTEGRAKFNMQKGFEDRDIYKGLTFWSPNVNIFRDPRWGRGHETFGEDPYLSSRLGVRFVAGLQGHDDEVLKSAACAKHYAVHSGPESLRHSFDARASEQDMRETYLPAFKACVQEGKVEAVMGAYNRTNGKPCCGSRELLIDILRKEWGFKGHVVTDCWAIKDFHEGHMVTKSRLESVAMAMNNGCDLNCGSLFYLLEQAVSDGLVSETRLREAVTNLYATRFKLGFMSNTASKFDNIAYKEVDSAKMQQLNLESAMRCAVLLKNENNILPLDKNKIKTVGIIGPNANNRKALVGNYEGTASRYFTISEGIQEYLGSDVRVMVSEGCHLYNEKMSGLGMNNDRISEVKGVCVESDIIIAVMGLDSGLEGEEGDKSNQFASGDKIDLNLPGLQQEVLQTIYQSGKPVILVCLSGSALAITWAADNIPAIIQGWYPGAQGGRAIARLIFGEADFEGKLPVTFYRTTEELPEFTDYSMKNRTYRYMKNEALYPFGYGLSYSDYKLENVKISSAVLSQNGKIIVSAEITNTGDYDGRQTVQLYIKSPAQYAPNHQLKGLKKIYLKKHETKKVEIDLPCKAFGLYNEHGKLTAISGNYILYVGMSQPDNVSVRLTGKQPLAFEVDNKSEIIFDD